MESEQSNNTQPEQSINTSNTSHLPDQKQHIERVAIKPPPFWRENSKLWFSHLEAQFATNGVQSDETKYYYTVAALDEAMLKLVSDIVTNPPNNDKYSSIKNALIKSLSESETQRLQRLLQGMELGDQKPSQLLRQMKACNDFQLQDSVLRNLWLQRLPQQAQAVLAASTGDLNELAILADRISETFQANSIFSMSSGQTKEKATRGDLDTVLNKLEEVNKRLSRVEANRSTSRSKSPTHGTKFPVVGDHKYCWFHFRFGKNAKKCAGGTCQFKKQEN